MTARRQHRPRRQEVGSQLSLAGYVTLRRDTQISASIHSVVGGYDSPPLCLGGRRRSSKSADRILGLSVGCFPLASPAFAAEAGKHKCRKAGPLGQLNLLRKVGAGEGIRTLDPDLGKVGNATLVAMHQTAIQRRRVRLARNGAGGRNRTDTSVRKPDFASHYGFRHDTFALQHRRFDGLDFIFTMGCSPLGGCR